MKVWGKSWEEAIGKTCLELGYPDWHAAMHDREIDQVIATRVPVRGEVPFATTFGERIYEYILVPVIGPGGEVEAVAGTTRDVTEQKVIEQSLRADEERKSFLLALADAMRRSGDARQVLNVAATMLGEKLSVDRTFYAALDEQQGVGDVGTDWCRAELVSLAGQYPLSDFREIISLMRDGQPLIIDDVAGSSLLSDALREILAKLGIGSFIAVPLFRDGRPIWSVNVAHRDRHEWTAEQTRIVVEVAERSWEAVGRVQALDELRRARTQAEQQARTLESTLSSVLDLVFRYTPDGRFDYANQPLLDLWGTTLDHALGKSMAELGYAPETEQHMLRELAKVIATGAPVEGETTYASPDGRRGHYAYKLAPLFDAKGKVVQIAGTSLDITERKRNELLLTEQQNVLELVTAGCELARCLEELGASVARLDEHTRAAVVLGGADGNLPLDVYFANVSSCFGTQICGLAADICAETIDFALPVTCADIARAEERSPVWRERCLAANVRSCHSVPFSIRTARPSDRSYSLSINPVSQTRGTGVLPNSARMWRVLRSPTIAPRRRYARARRNLPMNWPARVCCRV